VGTRGNGDDEAEQRKVFLSRSVTIVIGQDRLDTVRRVRKCAIDQLAKLI
jgi:hypothetical protein